MLELNYIREHKDEIIERLKVKNFNGEDILNRIVELDEKRRQTQKDRDNAFAESKRLSKDIGKLFKEGKQEQANALKENSTQLKNESRQCEEQLTNIVKELNELLTQVPNVPHPSVPKGESDEENKLVYEEGPLPDPGKDALPHWELAKKYDLIDFDLGSKISGSGFPVYKGRGAKLQRALINFFLAEAEKAGYEEIQPPLMVNEDSAFGTGQLPDKDSQMYYVEMDNMYLIPTAEVPITNIYRDVILKAEDFPVKNAAYSACFRREAGSYGKDVRGLNRLHQFDKVEIVQVQHPGKSYDTLEEMREYASGILRKLGLSFRILILCGGDTSFASALTYDLEVYSGAQQRWLEVSSVSNFEAFQSNRMKLRFKDENGKNRLAHTLNGSALALPRIVAALLENNQTPDGIKIPEALVPYTGFETIT
ncbi:MAG: serine--tRNA ligase [Bacteroidales bacterium]|nr:serine--tRNA ligase [Bacteroidales bacterium]